MKILNAVFLIIVLVLLPGHLLFADVAYKQIMGWTENAKIDQENLLIRAKLDTGAENSSINAPHFKKFIRKGSEWVRFDLTNHLDKKVTIERKVVRAVKIKIENSHPGYEERVVIKLRICVGKYSKEVEVNLNDRSDYRYQLLLGRSFLEGIIIVDPSIQFTNKPNCKGRSGS
ncbi:ATP-dependent zinc protease [Thermodesulfobacteriota bacterium]